MDFVEINFSAIKRRTSAYDNELIMLHFNRFHLHQAVFPEVLSFVDASNPTKPD